MSHTSDFSSVLLLLPDSLISLGLKTPTTCDDKRGYYMMEDSGGHLHPDHGETVRHVAPDWVLPDFTIEVHPFHFSYNDVLCLLELSEKNGVSVNGTTVEAVEPLPYPPHPPNLLPPSPPLPSIVTEEKITNAGSYGINHVAPGVGGTKGMWWMEFEEDEDDLGNYRNFRNGPAMGVENGLWDLDGSPSDTQRQACLDFANTVKTHFEADAQLNNLGDMRVHVARSLNVCEYVRNVYVRLGSRDDGLPCPRHIDQLRFDPEALKAGLVPNHEPECFVLNRGNKRIVPFLFKWLHEVVKVSTVGEGIFVDLTFEMRPESAAPSSSSPAHAESTTGSLHDPATSSLLTAHPPATLLAGVGVAPRIQRGFHFDQPLRDPPTTPLLTSTSSPSLAGPLPSATFSAERLAAIDAAIAAHPSEEQELAGHPNRPLVNSFIRALRFDGFEPEHDGTEPAGVDPGTVRFPLEERHRRFIWETVEGEIAKGWVSPGTAQPIPGVSYNSVFVVESENHRPRVVSDHTTSGLNDGIPRESAPAVYDSVLELIRLLRWHRYASGRLSPAAVLWKLDVSSAFKLLVMSKRWQARQGIIVLRPDSDGGWRKSHHVEWRGVFGGRAMPFLWTRFMSLLLWIARRRCILEHPLAYMDDQFHLDLRPTFVSRLDEAGAPVLLPASQAAVSDLWLSLGIPHKISNAKAPRGRAIDIVGFRVDLDAFSVSLPPSAVQRLVNEIAAFLATPDWHPSLRRWRQMAGWLSWALNVAPLARPLVTLLYLKMAGKTRSDAGVPLNLATRSALASAGEIIATSPSLDLSSPSLTRWALEDADMVIYCDACLANDNGMGAGLGFWTMVDGALRVFASRPGRTYQRIQFAEAIEILTASPPSPLRRVLVRTDSSPAVYALDSGAAVDGDFLPLRTLTLRTYALSARRRFNLKVQHVAGAKNILADQLSWLPIAQLRRQFGASLTERRVHFASRPLPAPPAPSVPIQPAAIRAFRDELQAGALEQKTCRDYDRAMRQWTTFVLAMAVDWIPSIDPLSSFVAWRFMSVASIYQTLSGLADTFEPLMGKPAWEAVRGSQVVLNVIAGGTKRWKVAVKRAIPLPFAVIDYAIRAALSDPRLSYDRLLFFAMLAVGFACCNRAAELAVPASLRDRNPAKVIKRATVEVTGDSFQCRIPYTKANRLFRGGFLLFVDSATHYALRGWPPKEIWRQGRWRSDTWDDYIRVTPSLALALARQRA
ncbi:hypothetical protein JCM1840_002976 [Sporobolomyces johnsonii]